MTLTFGRLLRVDLSWKPYVDTTADLCAPPSQVIEELLEVNDDLHEQLKVKDEDIATLQAQNDLLVRRHAT